MSTPSLFRQSPASYTQAAAQGVVDLVRQDGDSTGPKKHGVMGKPNIDLDVVEISKLDWFGWNGMVYTVFCEQ